MKLLAVRKYPTAVTWVVGIAIVCNLGWLSAATAEDSSGPCFSAAELKDDINQIRDFAANAGSTTRESCEARLRFNEDEIFGFLDVTAIEVPDDTFTGAFVGEALGLPGHGTFCDHTLFFDDDELHPRVLVKNLDDNQAQACLAEILKAYTKSLSKDKK